MKMELLTLLMVIASVQWAHGKFLGCYEDNDIRLMTGFNMYMYNVNSPARCIYLCQQLQFKYAGVEFTYTLVWITKSILSREDYSKDNQTNTYIVEFLVDRYNVREVNIPSLTGRLNYSRNQCFCGSDVPYALMKRDLSECKMKCPFSEEICGDEMRISIYSTDYNTYPSTDPGTYIGCYLEYDKDKTLNNYQVTMRSVNPKSCTHTCTILGYMYAGVEPNDLCFCGNTKPAYERKTQETECNVQCHNSEGKCGGNGRISIYKTSINSNAESVVTVSDERLKRNAIGCFEDSEQRILSEYCSSLDVTNSPKNCLYLCQQLHFKYAGVHNGADCFCGNVMPSPSRRRNNKECQVSCPNSAESCGGQMRTYVYSTEMFPTLTQSASGSKVFAKQRTTSGLKHIEEYIQRLAFME